MKSITQPIQKSILIHSDSQNSLHDGDTEAGQLNSNELEFRPGAESCGFTEIHNTPASLILERHPGESLLNFSKREFKSRQKYWISRENPTLLVHEQLTPEKIQAIKERVELCGLIASPVYQWCSCGYRRGEFQCNYAHLCKRCAKRKARKISKSIKANISHLPNQINGFRQKRLRFLTLTIGSSSDPLQARKSLISSLNRFLNRRYQKDRIDGSISSIHTEKSKGHDGLYHVHFHLMIYSRWLDSRNHTLSHEWKKATRGAGQIVHIEALRNQNQAIDYLSNYLLKHNPGSFEERLKLFFRTRYFFRYGCFNRGSPKHIFFFQEELICAVCQDKIQAILSNSEEGKYFGDLDPPKLPKPITRFYAVCPSCDLHVDARDWNDQLEICQTCADYESFESKKARQHQESNPELSRLWKQKAESMTSERITNELLSDDNNQSFNIRGNENMSGSKK